MLLNFVIQTMVEELRRLFDKYLEKIQDFKKESQCKELVPVCELNAVVSLCKLFDSLATPENGVRIVLIAMYHSSHCFFSSELSRHSIQFLISNI